MPFENCASQAFTAASIQQNAPQCPGLYGLSNAREWIFIGAASDIRAALMDRLRERNGSVALRKPTGFTFEVLSPADCSLRQNQLVRELEPFCNRRGNG
ncbi:MAG TPA: hypothetical protein VFB14_14635 [Bryobacteraceae bacterium]|jgi:hypothetical protein|nr:hypothetical protein [Bryobacteraceae bacterium]